MHCNSPLVHILLHSGVYGISKEKRIFSVCFRVETALEEIMVCE